MRVVSVCAAVALNAVMAMQAWADDAPARFEFQQGDRIAIVGNTFAERLGQFGNFETLLQATLPDHKLTVRNMAWPADTPALQPRPLNFGDIKTHLAEQKADVVFLCFGMNESFAGADGLPQFEQDLAGLIKSFKGQDFNGDSPPRLVLVSPIPHENLGGLLPNPAEHNAQLAAYTEAMRKLAGAEKIWFVDLYNTVNPLMADARTGKFTANGIHLNEYGDGVVAPVLVKQLGLSPPSTVASDLRAAVNEKDRQFYFRWRAVNGEYIYGRRKEPFGIVSFPPEMKQLDEMVADRDQRIWAAAKPQTHTLEFVPAGS